MKCIRCECLLPSDFAPLDERGDWSQCETCFEMYMNERGWPDWPDMIEPPEGVPGQPIPAP